MFLNVIVIVTVTVTITVTVIVIVMVVVIYITIVLLQTAAVKKFGYFIVRMSHWFGRLGFHTFGFVIKLELPKISKLKYFIHPNLLFFLCQLLCSFICLFVCLFVCLFCPVID